MEMNRFYLARLLDEDGGTLASDQVWITADASPEDAARDAAAFFDSDEHGVSPVDRRLQLFGPFVVMTPAATFTVSEAEAPATDFFAVTLEPGEPEFADGNTPLPYKPVPICTWYADDPERGTGWFYDTAEDSGGYGRISPEGPYADESAAQVAAQGVFGVCTFSDGLPDHYEDGDPPNYGATR